MSTVTAEMRTGQQLGIALVVVLNALPVWGVLAGEWSIGALMVLFWLENVAAGLVHALRMAIVGGPPVLRAMKIAMIPFFCLHYGLFTLGHAFFVFGQFVEAGESVWTQPGMGWAIAVAVGVIAWQGWEAHRRAPALPAAWTPTPEELATPLGRRLAREQAGPMIRLMMEPYLRVGILHVVIVVGGGLALLLGSPLVALLMLVLLKAAYEVALARGFSADRILLRLMPQ